MSENAKQRQYLLLSDVPEVFYGGAAGGGKTYATLIAAAQFVDVPGYAALLLRENFGDLNQPGSWIPLSKAWWRNKADWSEKFTRWTFPSGATITFGYLERDDDVYQYDTASFQTICIDELTQHTEWRYRFMFGRLRRPTFGPLSQVPIRMRSGSNPGNKGHDWVKKRFIDPRTREAGAVFVPATLDDNAANLDVESYKRDSLSKLDPLTRAQRERGDWDAVSGGRFQRAWFKEFRFRGDYCNLDGRPHGIYKPKDGRRFITIDPAASAKNTADYTVISTWAVSPWGDLIWLACDRFQKEIPDILPHIQKAVKQWKPSWVGIEAIGANRAVLQLARRSATPPIPACEIAKGERDKLVHATCGIAFAASGKIFLPADGVALDFPKEDVLSELVRFTGDEDKDSHDDVVDTLSYTAELIDWVPSTRVPPPRVLGGVG